MDRLRGFGSFLVITAIVFLGLRSGHLLVGAFYPASLPGPFQLDTLDETERYAGFWPHIPFYRPISLGTAPVEIVAERRPHPSIRVRWWGEASLELTEWAGGFRPEIAASAAPLPDLPRALYWSDGDEQIAVLKLEERWIRVCTNLGLVELRRIIDTLLPYDRLI